MSSDVDAAALAMVFEEATHPMVLLTADAVVCEANRAARDLVGYEPRSAAGVTCGSFFRCRHEAEGPRCGQTDACPECTLRDCVARTIETGEGAHDIAARVEVRRNGASQVWPLRVSSRLVRCGSGDRVLLDVEPLAAGRSRRELLDSALFDELARGIPEGMALHEIVLDAAGRPVDYVFLRVNPAFERHSGLRAKDVLGRRITEALPGIEKTDLIERYGRVALTGESTSFETYVEASDRHFTVTAYQAGHGRFVAVFEDISARKRLEAEQETTLYLLRSLYEAGGDERDLLREITRVMRDWSECDAVGVRLRVGEDYPYYETRGFPEEFVEAERQLCARDKGGEVVHDSAGNAVLECMCGNVIRGRFDPSLPFFTANGSFWSNCTTDLLASTTEADRQSRTRNRCNGDGYESVALVPLRTAGQTLGLLQFNDLRRGRFTPEKIAALERFATSLAAGLAHRESVRTRLSLENRFARAFHGSPVMTTITRVEDGRYLDVNDAFVRTTGYSRDAAIGRTCVELGFTSEADHEGLLAKLASDGRVQDTELEFTRADGSKLYGLYSCLPIEIDGEERLLSTAIDITDRKLMEERSDWSENKLRSIFRVAPVGIGVMADRVFQEVNRSFCDMLGYGEDELLGRDTRLVYASGNEYERAARESRQQVARQGTSTIETVFRRKDGQAVDVLLSSTPLDRANWSKGVTFTVLDITARKKVEQQLRQAQKMEAVGRLAAGVAHDFNNQLQVIVGYCDMLREQYAAEDTNREMIDEIRKASDRALSTTTHLLAFSRRQNLEPVVVDVREFLGEIEKPIGRMIGEDVRLVVSVPPDVSPLLIDRAGLHQAILNVVVNARDAMPRGGKLIIQAEDVELDAEQAALYIDGTPGHYVRLDVTDTGTGMDCATLEQLFEPFFTTKEPGKGTGLGMPMVLGFLRQSNGFIRVESQLGRGCAVRMLLPVATADALRSAEAAGDRSIPRAERGATVLVVEDEHSVRKYLKSLLETAGYQTFAVSGPREAIDLVANGQVQPDMVLSDVVMPEMRGNELADRLRELAGSLPVLLMSGYADVEIVGYEIIAKPFCADRLLHAVQKQLDAHRAAGP